MILRQFLVVFDSLPVDSISVKKGNNHPNVVTAARCVNVGLFVSGNLRRDVVVSIATGTYDDLQIISFPGATLRRVSPDERSVTSFLLKASTGLSELERGASDTMVNGILLERTSIETILELWNSSRIYRSIASQSETGITTSSDGLYIYEISEKDELQTSKIRGFTPLIRPKTAERFILDVNLTVDKTCKTN